jgi:hypothetical protein
MARHRHKRPEGKRVSRGKQRTLARKRQRQRKAELRGGVRR